MVYSESQGLAWTDEAECKGLDRELFFDIYEQNPKKAAEVDELCFTCPVRLECLKFGVDTNGTGCFGGTYLILGKYSKARNNHKPAELAEYCKNKVKELD